MKSFVRSVSIFVLLSLLFAAAGVGGTVRPGNEAQVSNDRTLSPYFFVKSDDPSTDHLPLKSTRADVNIAGVIADVKVTQVYRNDGKRPIEAVYIFPASTRAAVYGMKMTIGERTVVAKIRKRDEARREYEQARQEGRNASLLEQHRPNVFQMNVANIMPGDIVRVELSYTELLVPEEGVYEFVYPTVVGPRYSNKSVEGAPQDKWVANPYTHQGEAPAYKFDIDVKIAAGLPVRDIRCASHNVHVSYEGPATASVRLDNSEGKGGNRSYVLRYRLEGNRIESGLLLYKGKSENFFLLMMQPPKRVTLAQIPGREYIFIVDVSGSMYGYPLEISKKLLRDLIGNLRPTDTFNLLLFAGGSSVMSEHSLPATPENIRKAISMIDSQRGGGGTELLPALKRALSLPRTEGFSRSVIIATDGYVTVETEAFDFIRKNLSDANMFTFGIGTSVNRYLLEGMARAGMGEPFVIATEAEAAVKAEKFRRIVQSPVLTSVKLDFGKFDVYDVEPLSVPDVMADRPVIVFGKWRGNPVGNITLRGIAGDGPYAGTIGVGKVMPSQSNSALKYLWARNRISVLSDYNVLQSSDNRIEEVTRLGLDYNLLTTYTSFVAIDSEVRNRNGQSTTVNQPLPLPEGVSDYAVGGHIASYSAPSAVYKSIEGVGDAARGGYLARQESAAEYPKEAQKRGIVALEKVEASDTSVTERVQKAIEGKIGQLQNCNPVNLHGRMIVRLVIGIDGKVRKAVVLSGGLKNKALEKCVIEQIKKWHLDTVGFSSDTTAKITMLF